MRFRTSLGPALLLGLGATFIAACGAPDTGSPADVTAVTVTGVPNASGSVVSARDSDGKATFVWAAPSHLAIAGAATDVARAHLVSHASVLGISARVARSAEIARRHDLPGGGSVLSFEQKLGGIAVVNTRANVVMDRAQNLVAISGNLRGAVDAPAKVGKFTMSPEAALSKAYRDHFGVALDASAIADAGAEDNGEYRSYTVVTPANGPRVVDTARIRKVYFPQKGRLVAAYHAEFLSRAPHSTENAAWLYAIAADDGRTLMKKSLTAHEKFTYRVWAETGAASQHNIPLDGPLADATPIPATATVGSTKEPGFAPTVLVTVDGFNKNPAGASDPWLPPTATTTVGNNVSAYTDRNNQDDKNNTGDGFDEGVDIRATTTAPLTFDRQYNTSLNPNASQEQMKAAVTQIFYVTNWMHDYWYDSGFNEAAGNGQLSNLGRGGVENDPLLAEAQDGADFGQANNANMSPFTDGKSPRMQMYVWDGPPTTAIATTPTVAFTDKIGEASFGPTTFDITKNAALATPADGCTAVSGVSGKIAIIDRGACAFAVKAKAAQDAGASGVIIVNNAPGHIAPGLAGDGATTVTIPVGGLSLEDGALLKAKMGAGTVSVHLQRTATTTRDGTIDNTVVAHEWGHYLHLRQVCSFSGSNSCSGMSEGWADFNALMMIIKETDSLDGTTFPLTQYAGVASSDDAMYFGIRRAPYSSDLAKDPLTFKYITEGVDLPTTAPLNPIPNNSEAHNTGEIWAISLYEAYTNLLRDSKGATPRFTFTDAKRRMADYVVAGMQTAPSDPTFTEQRDAVLAVAYARDPKDFIALAKGFAKRGLGVGAVAPPSESQDYKEAKEDFSVKGNLGFLDAKIDDAIRSCDRDGFLDADEKGDVTIRLKNVGWVNLANTTATVTTTAPGVTFDKGGAATVASLDPFGVAKVRVTASFDAAATKMQFIPITVTLANGESLEASVTGNIEPRGNFDIAEKTVKIDDVESPNPTWTQIHGVAKTDAAWTRVAKTDDAGKPLSPPDYQWVGADLGMRSDESLVSPSLTVSATEAFKVSFKHKYSFEFGPNDGMNGPLAYFDGAVLEISKDDGATWEDIKTYVNPGYTQTINTNTATGGGDPATDDNPLAGRLAYAGELTTVTPVSLDLGTQLAGKTVKIRFRVASDPASAAPGWEVDDIGFSGITNTPFAALVDDASVCKGVPIPVAGAAQTVAPGAVVKLDASGSSDPDGDPITFVWTQLDGADVDLTTPDAAKAGFTAPMTTEVTKLTFRVTVADAKQAASDTVEITVDPKATSNASGPRDDSSSTVSPVGKGDDCGCSTVGTNGKSGLGAIGAAFAGALALIARKRRKQSRVS